jgi:hypothetical protein
MLLSVKEDRVNYARRRLESIDSFTWFSILLMELADHLAGPHIVLECPVTASSTAWESWHRVRSLAAPKPSGPG